MASGLNRRILMHCIWLLAIGFIAWLPATCPSADRELLPTRRRATVPLLLDDAKQLAAAGHIAIAHDLLQAAKQHVQSDAEQGRIDQLLREFERQQFGTELESERKLDESTINDRWTHEQIADRDTDAEPASVLTSVAQPRIAGPRIAATRAADPPKTASNVASPRADNPPSVNSLGDPDSTNGPPANESYAGQPRVVDTPSGLFVEQQRVNGPWIIRLPTSDSTSRLATDLGRPTTDAVVEQPEPADDVRTLGQHDTVANATPPTSVRDIAIHQSDASYTIDAIFEVEDSLSAALTRDPTRRLASELGDETAKEPSNATTPATPLIELTNAVPSIPQSTIQDGFVSVVPWWSYSPIQSDVTEDSIFATAKSSAWGDSPTAIAHAVGPTHAASSPGAYGVAPPTGTRSRHGTFFAVACFAVGLLMCPAALLVGIAYVIRLTNRESPFVQVSIVRRSDGGQASSSAALQSKESKPTTAVINNAVVDRQSPSIRTQATRPRLSNDKDSRSVTRTRDATSSTNMAKPPGDSARSRHKNIHEQIVDWNVAIRSHQDRLAVAT